jgi:hypothetical protein
MIRNFIVLGAFACFLFACGSGKKNNVAEPEAPAVEQPKEKMTQEESTPVIPGKSTWKMYSFDVNVLPYEGKGALILTMRFQAFQHQEKYPLEGVQEILHTISTDIDKNNNPEVYSLARTSKGLKCWGLAIINDVQPVELMLENIGTIPENTRWLASNENGLQLLDADSTSVGSIAVSQVNGKMNFQLN